jgi:hypothetical protein
LIVDFCRDKKKVKPVIAGQLSSNKNQLDEENPTTCSSSDGSNKQEDDTMVTFDLENFKSVAYDSPLDQLFDLQSDGQIDSIKKLDANMTAALLKTLRMEAEVLTDELGLSEDPDSLFKDFNKLVNACSALQLDDTQLSGIETVEEDELPSYIREEDNLSFSSEEDNVPLSQNNKSIIDLPSSRSSRSIHDQKIAGSELSWVAHRKDYF